MGKNRRRFKSHPRSKEASEDEATGPPWPTNHRFQNQNTAHRNSPRPPLATLPPSMHPNYYPFVHPKPQTFSFPPNFSPNQKSQRHKQNRDREPKHEVLIQSDYAIRQRNLKKHLVQTLNQAVQTIELWLPETSSSSSGRAVYVNEGYGCGACGRGWERGGSGEEGGGEEDEMDWQHEDEMVIPQPYGMRYVWDVCPGTVFERPGFGVEMGMKDCRGEGRDRGDGEGGGTCKWSGYRERC